MSAADNALLAGIVLLLNPFMLLIYVVLALIIVIYLWMTGYFKKSGFTTYDKLETGDKYVMNVLNTDPDVEVYFMTNTNGDRLTTDVTSKQTETNLGVLTMDESDGGAGVDDDDIAAATKITMPSAVDPNINTLLTLAPNSTAGTFPTDLIPILETRLKSLTRIFRYVAIRMMIIQAQKNILKEELDEVESYWVMCRNVLLGHNDSDSVESRPEAIQKNDEVEESNKATSTVVELIPNTPNARLSNNKVVAISALKKRFPIVEMFGLWANRIFYKGAWYRFDVKALQPYVNLPTSVSSLVFKCSSVASNCDQSTLRMCDVLSYQLPTQLFDAAALAEDPEVALETTSTYQKCDSATLYGWYVLMYNYIGFVRDDFYNQRYRSYTRTLGGGLPTTVSSTHWGKNGPYTRSRKVDILKRCYHKDVINPRKDGNKNPIAYPPKFDLSYDRGVGVLPKDMVVAKGCSGNLKKRGASCYDPNVTNELFYTRGSKCKWKKGKLKCSYNNPRTGYKCSGPSCAAIIKGQPNDCPDGYKSSGPQTCERIDKCPDGQEFNAGLCYKKCRDGYTGAATMCVAKKPTATCTRRPDAYRVKDLLCVPRVLNKDRRGKQIYKCPRKRDYTSQVKTYNKDLSVPYPENPYQDPEPVPEDQQPANLVGNTNEMPVDDSFVLSNDNDPSAAEDEFGLFSSKFMSKFSAF